MSEVQRYIVATLPGRMTRDCVEVVEARDYDALDAEIQCLRGANARKSIVLSIVDEILEDGEYEATSLDAEYWDDLHDKAIALQRAHTDLKAENARLRKALLRIADKNAWDEVMELKNMAHAALEEKL